MKYEKLYNETITLLTKKSQLSKSDRRFIQLFIQYLYEELKKK